MDTVQTTMLSQWEISPPILRIAEALFFNDHLVTHKWCHYASVLSGSQLINHLWASFTLSERWG